MRKKLSQSIQAKTFLSMLALLVVCCAAIYGMVMVFLPQNTYSELVGRVVADMDDMALVLVRDGWEDNTGLLLQFSLSHDATVQITDVVGNVLFTANAGDPGDTKLFFPDINCDTTFQWDGQTYRLVANSAPVAAAQVHTLLRDLIPLVAAVILLISAAGAFICSRYYSRPLLGISRVAKQMAALDLTGKCETRRRDEIGVLAASLNEMSAQLSEALTGLQAANLQLQQDIEREREQEKQRIEFFTAVSHELKTPIAILKGQLEGMLYQVGEYKDRDTYLRRCLKTTGDMEALVKEILAAARMGGSDFRLTRTDLDISGMLQSVCRKFLGPMEDKRIRLCTDIRPGVRLQGDPQLMEKVFTNVIGNAVAYSPPGAVITVTQTEGLFSVENSGIHIAEEDLARIFTPFYRVDKSRSRNSGGSGLGLYITKTILDHHGIRCAMSNTETGVLFTAFLQE